MSRVQGLADLGDLEIGPSILKKPLTNKEFVRLSSDSQMAENALTMGLQLLAACWLVLDLMMLAVMALGL